MAVIFTFRHLYCFVSFRTICDVISCWGFLIVRVINFLQAFEENSPFSAYRTALFESKTNWSGISKLPSTVYIFGYYYQLVKLEDTRLKIVRVSWSFAFCVVSLNYVAYIRLQTKFFKQNFHHHLDNFIRFPLIDRLWINEVTYGKRKTPLKVIGNLKWVATNVEALRAPKFILEALLHTEIR